MNSESNTTSSEISEKPTPVFESELLRQFLLRLSLIGCSAYLFWVGSAVYQSGELSWRPVLILSMFVLYGLAFSTLWLGATSQNLARWQVLIPVSLILALVIQYFLTTYFYARFPVYTDSFLITDYAAELLLLGQNPYDWDYGAVFGDYRAVPFYATPLLDGGEVSVLPYPAMSFLVYLPFKLLGLSWTGSVPLLALLAVIVLLYFYIPSPFSGLIILLLAIEPDFVQWAVGTVTDSLWFLFLVAMLVAWKRPILRAVFFGIACSFKQIPWLLVPFLVMRLWLDDDDPDDASSWKRVARFALVSASTFLIINGPFMVKNLESWWRSVFSPLFDPLIYIGLGLSTLTQLNISNLPKDYYLLATLTIFLSLLLFYWLNFQRFKEAMWLFPAIILWFSYRSLQGYFVYWPILLVLALVGQYERQLDPQQSAARFRIHRYTGPLFITALVILAAGFFYYSSRDQQIDVSLIGSEAISVYHVNRLQLEITNESTRDLTPRISVLSALAQPHGWNIESGPKSLEPGETATYEVTTDLPYRWISLMQGAQIIVTDANGDYKMRGSVTIPRDLSISESEPIYNANYIFVGSLPAGWELVTNLTREPLVQPSRSLTEMPGVELSLIAEELKEKWQYVELGQTIPFPLGDMAAWVNPPKGSSLPDLSPGVLYGLEFDDGENRLWVLFGDQEGSGFLEENHYYTARAITSQVWSQERLNLVDLYDQAGWDPPPLKQIIQGDLELLTRSVTVRLMLAGQDLDPDDVVSARFGPISIDQEQESVDRFINQLVDNRGEYYLILGDLAKSQRNLKKAKHYYETAVKASPELTAAHLSLGWTIYELDGCSQAIDHLMRALDLNPELDEAKRGLQMCN